MLQMIRSKERENVKYQKSSLNYTCIFPEDWDQLPIEEREKRLKKIQDFNLKTKVDNEQLWFKYISKMKHKRNIIVLSRGCIFLLCQLLSIS